MVLLFYFVIARSEATKQSRMMAMGLDCRASALRKFILSACKAVEGLAMTKGVIYWGLNDLYISTKLDFNRSCHWDMTSIWPGSVEQVR